MSNIQRTGFAWSAGKLKYVSQYIEMTCRRLTLPSFIVIIPLCSVITFLLLTTFTVNHLIFSSDRPFSTPFCSFPCLFLHIFSSYLLNTFPFPLLTCQPLFKIGHFLRIIKVVLHLYQDVHIFNHQFLTGEKEVK